MNLQLRSLIKKSGELELSLVDTPLPTLADDEVLISMAWAAGAAPASITTPAPSLPTGID